MNFQFFNFLLNEILLVNLSLIVEFTLCKILKYEVLTNFNNVWSKVKSANSSIWFNSNIVSDLSQKPLPFNYNPWNIVKLDFKAIYFTVTAINNFK